MPRVLVVEDSAVMSEALVEMIEQDPANEVAAVARHGHEAVELALDKRPDVITMDVLLPGLNGLEATKEIMRRTPCPIIMITSQANNEELETAFRSFTAGALAILEKPTDVFSEEADEFQETLLAHIRYLGNRKVHQKLAGLFSPIQRQAAPGPAGPGAGRRGLGICAGLGGALCLTRLLLFLPRELPMFLAVSLRMPRGFTTGFCRWLSGNSGFPVAMVKDDLVPAPGHVYFAADGAALVLRADGRLALEFLDDGDGKDGPADRLMNSLARHAGIDSIGVALSGTGSDGARGLAAIRQAGGVALGQDDNTSLACEISAKAKEIGAFEETLPLGKLGVRLVELGWRSR